VSGRAGASVTLDTVSARVYREPGMWNERRIPVLALSGAASLLAVALVAPSTATAAWPTRVLTAVEKDHPLPDINLGVSFDQHRQTARITREWVQEEGGQRRALDVKELDYEEITRRMLLELRVGLFRDLEFHAVAPLVLQNDSSLGFASGVAGQSTIWGSPNADDPSDPARFPLTEVPASRERSGFGDMTFGLAWSPLVNGKDESYPTMTLRGDVTVPTGALRDPTDQDALPGGATGDVGLGQTIFDLSLGFSKRMSAGAPALEPYMIFGARLPVAGPSQKARGMEPPFVGYLKVGTEVLIHESPPEESRYAFDLGFGLRYTSVGRTYSQLSDYLPSFDQTLVPRNRASGVMAGPDEVLYGDYANPANYRSTLDGATCGKVAGVPCGELTRVEEHLSLSGALALHLQPTRFLLLRGGVSASYTTAHALTTERVGTDTDPASAAGQSCPAGSGVECVGRVNAVNSLGQEERSPYYDPRYDAPGRRLRAEDILDLSFFFTAAALF
jgi:hypothetical protein